MARTKQAQAQQESSEEGEVESTEEPEEVRAVDDKELEARESEAAEEGESEGEPSGDERVSDGTEERKDETDAEREQRRTERRERRHRHRENVNRTYKEVRFLRARNEQLERRFSDLEARSANTEAVSLDSQIADVDSKIDQATRILSLAAKSDKPTATDDFAEATRIRDQLIEARSYLRAAKQQQGAVRSAPKPPDPEIIERAQEFTRNNRDWYDPRLGNQESKIADRISRTLDAEGYDPHSDKYWEELQSRVERHPMLKGFFEQDDDDKGDRDESDQDEGEEQPARRRANGNGHARGPRFAKGGQERPLKRGEVYISAERKEALQELGVWDDPVLRKRYLKRYADYDAQANTRG